MIRQLEPLTVDAVVEALSVRGSTWARADVMRTICDLQPPVPGLDGLEPTSAPFTCTQPPPAPAPVATSVEQLTALAALREQGVLTDAEFESEKAKILDG